MAERLSGKRIFLTGAAQGIGLAIAEACLAEGAKLFLVDRDSALLDKTVGGLAASHGQVGHATADMGPAGRSGDGRLRSFRPA